MKVLKRLKADTSGNFAIMLALLTVPVFGAAGLAIDYTKASSVRSQLQEQADAMALALASGGDSPDDAALLAELKSGFADRLPFGDRAGDVALDGEWISPSDYRISVSMTMPTTIAGVLQGGPMRIGAEAVARYGGVIYRYKPPQLAELEPEAWDYNLVSVYCFNPAEADNPAANYGRDPETMVELADNKSGVFKDVEMPRCGAGQALSLKLWNVIEGKHRGDWNKTNLPSDRIHTYYSDTTIEGGVEQYNFGYNILETVLCDTREQCEPKRKGGIIPEGKNRKPQMSMKPCEPGKFRYYGFEDRPPERSGSGSDSDYDDIRIIIECPEEIPDGAETVRLVR